MDTEGMGLSSVSDADLASLAGALERGDLRPPFGPTGLQARGFGHLAVPLQPFLQLDGPGLRAVVEVVRAERRHRRPPKLTLVWTGDDPGVGHSRHTRVVLPELFSRARQHVLVAGYSFDHGADLFRALHDAMATHGVSADFFVDIQQLVERLRPAARAASLDWALLSCPLASAREPRARGEETISLFFKLMWPFGKPHPRVYFDPRTATAASAVSLHAKCAVIDHELSLITSANFTDRGQTRNFEAGVAIEDRSFAANLERQWANLVEAGVVVGHGC
jgi:phosphatidylserine/phosphatidylglycerophosphate/cardiolipin synthase-like enzyme